MIYKTLHIKLTIEQHEQTPLKPGLNSSAPEGLAVPGPQVTAVMLLLIYTDHVTLTLLWT